MMIGIKSVNAFLMHVMMRLFPILAAKINMTFMNFSPIFSSNSFNRQTPYVNAYAFAMLILSAGSNLKYTD